MTRGMGAFRMAQMKHRDARVFALGQHLRIDLMEQIATEPFHPPEPPPPPALGREITPLPELPDEKLAYAVKDAAIALGVGRSTIWKAIAAGKLEAVKLGKRTLIPTASLREWLATLPAKRRP